MGAFLLISDDGARAERLARELSVLAECLVHDLYGDAPPPRRAEAIISDVDTLTSEAVGRLRGILAQARGQDVPYIFLVHGNAARAEVQARMLGASETLGAGMLIRLLEKLARRPGQSEAPSLAAARGAGTARLFLKETFLAGGPVTPALAESGTELVARAMRESGIRDWVRIVQRFDDALHQHCLLVAGLAAAFGTSLGLAQADQHLLTKAALLHDVGKTRIPIAILNKRAPLDAAETAVMRTHAVEGHAMLTRQGFESDLLAVVRSHHEMLDGSGYPDALAGEAIPDLVRLVTVCDIYAALIECRPYRAAMTGGSASSVLEGMAGQLDGDLVRAFRSVADAICPPGGSLPSKAARVEPGTARRVVDRTRGGA